MIPEKVQRISAFILPCQTLSTLTRLQADVLRRQAVSVGLGSIGETSRTSTISSIRPLQLINEPTAPASRSEKPQSFAAMAHPKNLPENATTMMHTVQAQMMPVFRSPRLVLSPDVPKYSGMKRHRTRSLIFSVKWTAVLRGRIRPAAKPPKIAEL